MSSHHENHANLGHMDLGGKEQHTNISIFLYQCGVYVRIEGTFFYVRRKREASSVKYNHLLPFGGLDVTPATAIQSITAITQRKPALPRKEYVKYLLASIILPTRGKNVA